MNNVLLFGIIVSILFAVFYFVFVKREPFQTMGDIITFPGTQNYNTKYEIEQKLNDKQ